jgi:restriction system protein
VILIDGDRLTDLMFEYGLGVSTLNTYAVKRVDNDYFDEDEV